MFIYTPSPMLLPQQFYSASSRPELYWIQVNIKQTRYFCYKLKIQRKLKWHVGFAKSSHLLLLTYVQDTTTEDLNDRQHWDEVRKAMEVIELSATEQEEIYRIVASVLHLGNTGFVEEEGRARLTNSMAVHTVAKVGSSKQCPDMIIDRGLLKK